MSNFHSLTMENYSDLTDEEIRRRLINDFNVQCGPVTPQTKRILLKKLIKLQQERTNHRNHSDHLKLNENFDYSFNNSNENQIEDEHSYSNGRNSPQLNGSDINLETPLFENQDQPMHVAVTSTPTLPKISNSRKNTQKTKILEEEQKEAIESFKEVEKTFKRQLEQSKLPEPQIETIKKSARNRKIHKSKSSNDEFSSENSDNEEQFASKQTPISPSASKFMDTLSSKLKSNPIMSSIFVDNRSNLIPSGLTRAPIRRTNYSSNLIEKSASDLWNYSDSDSDYSSSNKKDRICQILLNHRPGLGKAKTRSKQSQFKSRLQRFYQTVKKFFSSSTNESTNFSSSSNNISLALLIFVIIFFIVIFSIYFYSKFTYASKYTLDLNDYAFIEDKTKLIAPICEKNHQDDSGCLPFESDRKHALNIVKEIIGFIDAKVYESFCEAGTSEMKEIQSFKFKRNEFENELRHEPSSTESRDPSLQNLSPDKLFSYDLNNALILIKLNTGWNIHFEDDYLSDFSLTSNYVLNLPMRCRLKLYWNTNFWMIVTSFTAILASFLLLTYYRYKKLLEVQEQETIYDLIDKSMELLQSPDEPQSMPVLHIRDTLLSPAEKKSSKYKRIWNKVVDHIENTESRVKVEYKKIDGEDFKAWKWIANTTSSQYITDSENDSDYLSSVTPLQTQKIGGVEWQGQAFVIGNNKSNVNVLSSRNENTEHSSQPEISQNKNFQALTRFLKIRNIFEKEAQYVDPNWSTKIKNTILEKTAAESGWHDLVHIEIDDSTNEGLVFLKCLTIAGATNAFHALHGWWCEKKLVSVKFLKEERYYHRFPHARYMDTPLTITKID
ncbi:Inner nuclear membrane protein Man1 [Sarcoptes scabiei]|uniref:Inner nuclear membrane protein Man1 n=1 Tax=Sarcoptes scabiei TaxID=52283 RepID=A0A834R8D8_SARSC|nr:Inner nuclear membrane protein Man1 [Sarcoptes scabiei]